MSDKLVRAGYKVARVEQTETPEMLKARKKKGSKDKVVNRELVSIVTRGTRTFCYLDNELSYDCAQDGAGVGPLLVIREIQFSNGDEKEEESDTIRPVCEYGVVFVDASRAVITMGQFADDVLRTRMTTLLAAISPSEVLIEGENGASPVLRDLLKSAQMMSGFLIEEIQPVESFPKSTAVNSDVRQKLNRGFGRVHPWNVEETLEELHRREYFPRSSRKQEDARDTSRWPKVLHLAVEGNANLALSSLGAALFYLQRNLIDEEVLSMGFINAYVPSACPVASGGVFSQAAREDIDTESELDDLQRGDSALETPTPVGSNDEEENISHMALDGNTLCQLEILTNNSDGKVAGSLWSKINFTRTPHGARLLRAWLLRPLFRKDEIERRADAVEELLSGDVALAMDEARGLLQKCGDIERLLAKVHQMAGTKPGAAESCHPSTRAVLYETKVYTTRKVRDFRAALFALRFATKIPELFAGIEVSSGLLRKILKCFPDVAEDLDWFFNAFDFEKAVNGQFEPGRGIDADFDDAKDLKDTVLAELQVFREDMCTNVLQPRHLAKNTWKYINTAPDSKDKYVIELPVQVAVPEDFCEYLEKI